MSQFGPVKFQVLSSYMEPEATKLDSDLTHLRNLPGIQALERGGMEQLVSSRLDAENLSCSWYPVTVPSTELLCSVADCGLTLNAR